MKDILSRIAALERSSLFGLPVYNVVLANGESRIMALDDLAMYCVDRPDITRADGKTEPYKGNDRVLSASHRFGESEYQAGIINILSEYLEISRELSGSGTEFTEPYPCGRAFQ